MLFGKPVAVGSASPLKQSISLTNSITLSHTQDIFSLQFSALSFADPERNRYRYRLEGLEKQWNETDSDHRSATYTTLRPGAVHFSGPGPHQPGRLERERGKRSHPSAAPVVAHVVVRHRLRALDLVLPLGALQAPHV